MPMLVLPICRSYKECYEGIQTDCEVISLLTQLTRQKVSDTILRPVLSNCARDIDAL